MCLRPDWYMDARRGFTHHNCLLLCTGTTISHVNNNVMNLDALYILYLLLQLIEPLYQSSTPPEVLKQ